MSNNNAKQALGQPMRMTTFKPKETLLFTALQSMLLTWGSANDIWEVLCIWFYTFNFFQSWGSEMIHEEVSIFDE